MKQMKDNGRQKFQPHIHIFYYKLLIKIIKLFIAATNEMHIHRRDTLVVVFCDVNINDFWGYRAFKMVLELLQNVYLNGKMEARKTKQFETTIFSHFKM